MTSLDLGLIGNGTIGALLNAAGDIVWACFPRFDGDPAFCSLLRGQTRDTDFGTFGVELSDFVRAEQDYLVNTPILTTRLYDHSGGCVEITDFAPRFRQYGRMFAPMMLVRQIKRTAGNPRIRVRLRPANHYGRSRAEITCGSNHIRYAGTDLVLRLTTDASVTALVEENFFFLEDAVTLLLGPDETVQGAVAEIGRRFLEETATYWREWVGSLGIPFEWQDAVIRAAITLELNVCEDTGAIVAAMTTSIPEAPGSRRNWDYRYCWLRDAYFVVNALNRLGATRTMERYLGYIVNVVAGTDNGRLQPVYGLSGRAVGEEQEIDSLAGYRGMGPVRIGNQAHRQVQHDVYGAAILTATHVFFDRRLVRRGDEVLFRRLETLGDHAATLYDQPDAGIWELRGTPRVHTFSSVMCWAGCDRLAKIAAHLGLEERAAHWRAQAARIQQFVSERCWNPAKDSFVAAANGDTLDASLLRLNELGFLSDEDPRFVGTVRAIGRELKRGDFVFRYVEQDDFGKPDNAFLVCTFWYINALAAIGQRDEARALFETLLGCRNRHGLLAEHIDPRTREQWGNFVQTYSMVGLIGSAIRLSVRWDQAF
ncbi:MAG TPA: glycoside hydrolase family 15 protein [Gemmatimonadales bacterium]|nr:glycoside hydrolase family 15 protein [Gemmatimonadales bacterium]